MVVVLASCGGTGPHNGQNSLHPAGPAARKILDLMNPFFWVAVVIGAAVIGMTIFVAMRFRERPDDDRSPVQTHGNIVLEVSWTIIPFLILAVMAVPTVATIFDLAKVPKGPNVIHVHVDARQWFWQYEYTDKGTQFFTANEMHIPVHQPVVLTLTSKNVIHSFWVPQLAGKKDVVPGHPNTLTIEADRPGTFLGQCAEYCGLSHANMRFRVIAKSADDFDTWLQEQQQGPAQPLTVEVAQPDGTTKQEPAGEVQDLIINTFACAGCHTLDDSSKPSYGPNLTHLASRTVFASGAYKLNHKNLVDWLLNAPGMIPMESEDCRLPPSPTTTCVGMPSFTENTPKGQQTMTRAQAEQIADFLLGQT